MTWESSENPLILEACHCPLFTVGPTVAWPLTVIYVKAKKRRMQKCSREGHALYWKKMWFFVYFLSACVLMRTWRFAVMSCVCPLINYKLATEENVCNVRVCASCNHFPITWNKFYRNQWFYLAVFDAEYLLNSQSKNGLYFPNFRQYFPNKVKKICVCIFQSRPHHCAIGPLTGS